MPKKINLKLLQNRGGGIVKASEALKDVTPFLWDKAVLDGKTKIIVDKVDKKSV